MPSKSIDALIEPKILIWARKSIGLSIQEVAKKIKASEDIVIKWELGDKKPTLTQLKRLTNIYKRPLALFYSPQPPKEASLPKDFRNLTEDKRIPFSTKTLLVIRQVRRLQFLATELANILNYKFPLKISKIDQSENPENIAIKVREQLGIKISKQLYEWKNSNDAFNYWKKIIEKKGIFIFQISMPINEIRAFSMLENGLPSIVLNTKDSINGRIFSLLHELGHLLLNKSGICDMDEPNYSSAEIKSVEIFCNHFAGAILVPKETLLNCKLIKITDEYSDDILEKVSKEFKVSKEVILRRLLIFRKITENFYKEKRKEWRIKEEGIQKSGGWGIDTPRKCIRDKGLPFISLVLETYRRDKITYPETLDYLSIRIKHLYELEQLIKNKA